MVCTVRRLSLLALLFGLMLPLLGVTVVRAATITVSTITDAIHSPGCATDGFSQPCSLRDTVLFANANPGTTITLPAGIYTLTIPPDANDDATTGDLNLTASATINGADAATTIIQASTTDSSAGIDRVITTGNTGPNNITLNDLTIRNGRRASSEIDGGGGISVSLGSIVILNRCVVSGNLVTSSTSPLYGGGIDNSGTITLNDTMVVGNIVAGAGNAGGGIENRLGSTMTLNNTTVSNNIAIGGSNGGGIDNEGLLNIRNSIMSGNRAESGGGIASRSGLQGLTLINSTVNGNTAMFGGGLYSGDDRIAITNSTISGNTASLGYGGALYIFPALETTTVNNSTIAGNSSGVALAGSSRALILRNSLLANSTANCSGPLVSYDYNLSSDWSCATLTQPHDLNNVNPLVGPLANNGGPTQTHALLSDSPAIDRIPATGVNCPATDQRGVARPQNSACDIGAYEVVLNPAPVTRPGGSPDPNAPPPPAPPPRTGIPPAGPGVNPPAPLPPHR